MAAFLAPAPETAGIFFGTSKLGALLLNMSVLCGDDGIRHRLTESQAQVVVTNAQNAPRFAGEWFRTGDAASFDDGDVRNEGRADDLMIAAGYRIGPVRGWSPCASSTRRWRRPPRWGSPHERRGNVVKAFVAVADEQEPSDELAQDIQDFVRDRLSAYAYPRVIEFVDDLPKTVTGKIRRAELRRRGQTAPYAAQAVSASADRLSRCRSARKLPSR